MTQTRVNAASILRPEEVHSLIIEPLTQESVAFQVSTVVRTSSSEYRFPVLTGDPDTDWTPEGEELGVDEAAFDEKVATPLKVAGLTVVSNELVADSDPEASKVVGQRLVQSLRGKIDAAFFANTTANGPSGLGSISPTLVYGGTTIANTDPFVAAQVAAEKVGAKLTSFVVSADTFLELAKIKKATGSNEPLLATDAASPSGRTVAGLPLVISPHAGDDVIWGIPRSHSFVVLRTDATVSVDSSAFFTSDRTAVRVTARVDFAWPHEKAVVSILKLDEQAGS